MNFLDNQVDPATGTIRGRAVFRNPDGDLTPGPVRPAAAARQRARITALLIQDRAVGTDLDKRFVLVVDERPHGRSTAPVTLGPIVDGLRVVRSGLQAGDVVVVNGLQRVRPGVKVDPVVDGDGPPRAAGQTRRDAATGGK